MYYTSPQEEIVFVGQIVPERMYMFDMDLKTGLSVIWNTGDTARFVIDGTDYEIEEDSIFFLTGIQTIDNYEFTSLNVLQFNKAFYCVENHDSEVGCKGLLFFGATETPIIKILEDSRKGIILVWEILMMEIEEEDVQLKVEMLRLLLKRFLILCMRIHSKQTFSTIKTSKHIGLIREYSYLVEQHYKQYTNVADYARLLFKSPKTLSNVFKKHIDKTPLQVINDRRLIEAKRLLRYTGQSIQEIADELSFNDIQGFSHFFKKHIGQSPSAYRG